MRRTLLPLTALALVAALVACGPSTGKRRSKTNADGKQTTSTQSKDRDDDVTEATPAARPSPSPSRRKVDALNCKKLETAQLGNGTVRYNGYADPIPLLDGQWSGEDGAVVALQPPCAIGDVTGDDADDAVRAVMLDGGGTGKFWSLALWRNVSGRPTYVTAAEIGDRTPVESVTIDGRRVKVVYLTRPDDAAMAVAVIKRTAIYRLSGSTLVEVSHTDEPHTP